MERNAPDKVDLPATGHCQVCGAALSRVPVPFCPRCVAQQAALSLTELQESNWEATLARSFPHLKIHSALSGTWSQFAVERLEDGVQATLKISQSYEETEERHRQLRARALLECPGILQLLEYGWLDGVLYTVMEARDGASLSDLLSEGKLSRTQLLRLREQLEEIESAASAAGYPLALRPEDVAISPDGLPRLGSLWRTSDAIDYTWLTKDDLSGSEIGRYKIVRLLGEGGFAEVYLAKQTRPMPRQVALKILKSGMDTRQIIGRFETERNLLALLDHPNIATVFDAGATSSGQPFFAMEYVDGMPLTAFARHHRLPLNERLRLFVKLCQAVHHAHENGVVHRDLKPPNVLVSMVDSEPHLKVIDFGIAKVLGGPLGERTLYTELNQFVGSPGYMSPEQAELGALVDHRADIYALGAILFELLCDETPIPKERFLDLPHEAKVKLVRETTTATLTNRLENQSDAEGSALELQTTSHKLQEQAKSGLSEIVSKALNFNPAERYATARDFGDTVQAFLTGGFKKTQWWQKIPRPVIWSITTALVAAVIVFVLLHSHRRAEEAARLAAMPPAIDPPKLLQDPTRPPLIWIEPGTTMIGRGEAQRSVTFHHPFALGQFEVTQAEYQAVMALPVDGDEIIEPHPSYFRDAGAYAPVENVSWEDATRFCAQLSGIELERYNSRLPSGYIYSLPLEDEWEFAAKTGNLSQRTRRVVTTHFGQPLAWSALNSQADYSGGFYLENRFANALHGTQPVGRSYPNRHGLYDLIGNVAEWMHDFPVELGGALLSSNLEGPPSGGRGVIRGGSWASFPDDLDLGWRQERALTSRDQRIGFRIAAVHYESRAYAPTSKHRSVFKLGKQGDLRCVAASALRQPMILDFETLPIGPIEPDHPLFQAVGIDSIHVRSGAFELSLDPGTPKRRMLWSSQQNQLEVVDHASVGPFAAHLQYVIAFAKPQRTVGFRLSEHAKRFELSVGNGERFEDRILPQAENESRDFVIHREQPFDRLRLAPMIDELYEDGEFSVAVDNNQGFGLDRLLMEAPARVEDTDLAHIVTTAQEGEAFLSPLGPSKLSPVELNGEATKLAKLESQGFRFSRTVSGLPADVRISNAAESELTVSPDNEPGILLATREAGESHLILGFENGGVHLLSAVWTGLDRPPQAADKLLLFGENPQVPLAIYGLDEFTQASQMDSLNIHLRSTEAIHRLTFVWNLEKGQSRTLKHLSIGEGSRHEGWRLVAPDLPSAVVRGAGLVTVESTALINLFSHNVRKLSASSYLQNPVTARLPVGGLAVRVLADNYGMPGQLQGFAVDGTPLLFPTDDEQFQAVNSAVAYYSANRLVDERVKFMPVLTRSATLTPGLPQTFRYQEVAVTMRRLSDGQVSLRALGARSQLQAGKVPRILVGLSEDGQQRDWDNVEDPWFIRQELIPVTGGAPYWELEKTYPCDLAEDQSWAHVFAMEWLTEEEAEAGVVDSAFTDWTAWRAELPQQEACHILKRP